MKEILTAIRVPGRVAKGGGRLAVLLAALLVPGLAGCHAHHRASYEARSGSVSGGTGYGASVHVGGDSRLVAGLIIAVMLADGARYYLTGPDGSLTPLERAPEPDPSRRVSEQDCTRAVVLDGGNLRCR